MCWGAIADANVRNGATISTAAPRLSRITIALLRDVCRASIAAGSPIGQLPVTDTMNTTEEQQHDYATDSRRSLRDGARRPYNRAAGRAGRTERVPAGAEHARQA